MFFSEIHVIGKEYIPQEGPIVFVGAFLSFPPLLSSIRLPFASELGLLTSVHVLISVNLCFRLLLRPLGLNYRKSSKPIHGTLPNASDGQPILVFVSISCIIFAL